MLTLRETPVRKQPHYPVAIRNGLNGLTQGTVQSPECNGNRR